jgi:hypothetical protein
MTRDPLDRLLDQWQVGQPSADLASRIVAKSREVEQITARRGFGSWLVAVIAGGAGPRLTPQLAGLGLALLVGFWYGAGGVNGSVAQDYDASPLILGPNLEAEWQG